ncbi:MAG: hypothetical protein IJI83_03895 [Oscillospiraceae bacterium]|nr:hypothetical protein [Oscillospiraceae bacterium]
MKGEEAIEYGEFLSKTMKKVEEEPVKLKKRTAEEIQAEFAPIIAADQKGHD